MTSPDQNEPGRWRRVLRLLFGGGRKWLWIFALAFGPALVHEGGRGPSPFAEVPAPSPGLHRVLVQSNGYHAVLIVENRDRLPLGPPENPRAPWLEFSWGDRGFYMESRFWPWDVFGTVLWPTESVVYVRARSRPPALGAAGVTSIEMDAASLRGLLAAVEGCIRRDGEGRIDPFPRVPDYSGRFYPARGRYLWSDNCNRWLVERLHDAGRASSGRGILLPQQIPWATR